MNLKTRYCLGTVLCGLFALATVAGAQGTAFTYQGRLNSNGSPASGSYDVAFTLFATNSGGGILAGPVTNGAVTVNNGLFTTMVDFGNVFAGGSNWLEIAVSTNTANAFTTLSPRQQVTPVPYALSAASLALPAGGATIFSGTNSLLHYDTNYNYFTGPIAGNSAATGIFNTGDGFYALASVTSGSRNSAQGFGSLWLDNTGSYNTADGYQALNQNTSGSANLAAGYQTLFANTIGLDNSALGFQALANNTVGTGNAALGYQALFNNTTGTNNISIGYQAGGYITTGSDNIDIGNVGILGDNNIIRIGAGQTQTYIAGVLNGNGAGLTNLPASQLTCLGNNNGGIQNFFGSVAEFVGKRHGDLGICQR